MKNHSMTKLRTVQIIFMYLLCNIIYPKLILRETLEAWISQGPALFRVLHRCSPAYSHTYYLFIHLGSFQGFVMSEQQCRLVGNFSHYSLIRLPGSYHPTAIQACDIKAAAVSLTDADANSERALTLRAEAACAVLYVKGDSLTKLAAVLGRGRGALSAALPLALGAAGRPLGPFLPAAIHCNTPEARGHQLLLPNF